MLADCGQLDRNQPAASPVKSFRMVEIRDNGPRRRIDEATDQSRYRSVYLPLVRGLTPKTLEAFDPVSQTLVSGLRESTAVPTQALYLFEFTFVRQQALAYAPIKSSADNQRFVRNGFAKSMRASLAARQWWKSIAHSNIWFNTLLRPKEAAL